MPMCPEYRSFPDTSCQQLHSSIFEESTHQDPSHQTLHCWKPLRGREPLDASIAHRSGYLECRPVSPSSMHTISPKAHPVSHTAQTLQITQLSSLAYAQEVLIVLTSTQQCISCLHNLHRFVYRVPHLALPRCIDNDTVKPRR